MNDEKDIEDEITRVKQKMCAVGAYTFDEKTLNNIDVTPLHDYFYRLVLKKKSWVKKTAQMI